MPVTITGEGLPYREVLKLRVRCQIIVMLLTQILSHHHILGGKILYPRRAQNTFYINLRLTLLHYRQALSRMLL